MTQQELNALLALIQRIPLTPAEALWLEGLLRRLADQVQQTEGGNADLA